MKSRYLLWVRFCLPVCAAIFLAACLKKNTQPYNAESETTGRIEWREFKKWTAEKPRTMEDLRKRMGSAGHRAREIGETNEAWIYDDTFYDTERKVLIRVYEVPFTTNRVVKATLPDYNTP